MNGPAYEAVPPRASASEFMVVVWRTPGEAGPGGEPLQGVFRLVPRNAKELPGFRSPSTVVYGGERMTLEEMRNLLGGEARKWRQSTLDGVFVHVDDLARVVLRGQRLSRRVLLWALNGAEGSVRYVVALTALAMAAAVPAAAVLACRHWFGAEAAFGGMVGALAAAGVVGVVLLRWRWR